MTGAMESRRIANVTHSRRNERRGDLFCLDGEHELPRLTGRIGTPSLQEIMSSMWKRRLYVTEETVPNSGVTIGLPTTIGYVLRNGVGVEASQLSNCASIVKSRSCRLHRM